MSSSSQTPMALSQNAERVLAVLQNTDKPLTAYQLLDALRASGLRAPTQIYRALDQLIAGHFVHKLDKLGAYVACQTEAKPAQHEPLLLICSNCQQVQEAPLPQLDSLDGLCARQQFDPQSLSVEIMGLCRDCRVAG